MITIHFILTRLAYRMLSLFAKGQAQRFASLAACCNVVLESPLRVLAQQ